MDKKPKSKANHYFNNPKVEELVKKYVLDGAINIELRNEIMSHAIELIENIIRVNNFANIIDYPDEASIEELKTVAWQAIEMSLYKFNTTNEYRLKSNIKIKGELIEENDDFVIIKNKGEVIELDKKSIRSTKRFHTKIFGFWCVSPDTLLLTNRGIINIDNIINKPGEVYGINGLSKNVASIRKSKTDTLKIKTELGYEIECTPEHYLHVLGKEGPIWKKAADIRRGNQLAIQYNQDYWANNDLIDIELKKGGNWNQPPKINQELAYIIGLFISKGSYTNKQFRIYATEEDIIQKLLNNNLGLKFTYDKKLTMVYTCNVRFIEFLQKLGFAKKLSAPTKIIPDRLMGCSKEIIKSLLMGLGNTFSSKKLINQIRMILLNLGVLTKISTKKNIFTIIYEERENASNIIWLPVRGIKKSKAEVCDIMVEDESHSYIANGIVSHNSQVSKTAILAHIKKDKRDKRNKKHYTGFLINKHKTTRKYEVNISDFIKESKRIFIDKTSHSIIDAIYTIYTTYQELPKSIEKEINKITSLNPRVIRKFFNLLKENEGLYHKFLDNIELNKVNYDEPFVDTD